MLRTLLFLRNKLPEQVWSLLRTLYWKRFWRRAFEEEQASVPNAPAIPIDGSERAVLIESIVDCWPFRNALEVGCSYGQNFTILAPLLPGVGFVGIDADSERLQHGTESLHVRGIYNVSLSEARVENLSEFADNSFDVVYSCALFLYLEPELVEAAFLEMLRVAKKRVLLMEQHLESPEPSAEFGSFVARESGVGGYWLREYRGIAERLAPGAEILLRKIPSPRWPAEQWRELAHLIEIRL